MSEREMVDTFIASGRVKRFEGYTGTPKGTKRILLFNATKQKRQKTRKSASDIRNLNSFGKYIEMNF